MAPLTGQEQAMEFKKLQTMVQSVCQRVTETKFKPLPAETVRHFRENLKHLEGLKGWDLTQATHYGILGYMVADPDDQKIREQANLRLLATVMVADAARKGMALPDLPKSLSLILPDPGPVNDRVEAMKKQISSLEETVRESVELLQDKDDKFIELIKDRDAWKAKVGFLEKQIQGLETARRDFVEKAREHETKFAELAKDRDEWKALAEQEKVVPTPQSQPEEVAKLRSEIEDLQERNAALMSRAGKSSEFLDQETVTEWVDIVEKMFKAPPEMQPYLQRLLVNEMERLVR